MPCTVAPLHCGEDFPKSAHSGAAEVVQELTSTSSMLVDLGGDHGVLEVGDDADASDGLGRVRSPAQHHIRLRRTIDLQVCGSRGCLRYYTLAGETGAAGRGAESNSRSLLFQDLKEGV